MFFFLLLNKNKYAAAMRSKGGRKTEEGLHIFLLSYSLLLFLLLAVNREEMGIDFLFFKRERERKRGKRRKWSV